MTIKRMRLRLLAPLLGTAGVLFGTAVTAGQPKPPSLKGTHEKGTLETILHRGANVPDEIYLIPTPNNCEGHVNMKITWDEEKNFVRLELKGQNALYPNPSVDRTEGVNYFPNPFWPEPEDFTNGRYQLWVILLAEPVTFYYDAITFDLLGSEHEFPSPPPNTIPLLLPVGHIVPTDFIYPDKHGNVDFVQEWAYDAMVRGDLPEYSHSVATFIPHNLCKANPWSYAQTSTRPWITDPRPASEAHSFSDFLRAGMQFDMTVEPPEYYVFPPRVTNAAAVSNVTNISDGIPKGWTLDFEAVFGNLAPPMRPFPEGASCEPWYKPKRDRDFDLCAQFQDPSE
jgi:hypothetical protein